MEPLKRIKLQSNIPIKEWRLGADGGHYNVIPLGALAMKHHTPGTPLYGLTICLSWAQICSTHIEMSAMKYKKYSIDMGEVMNLWRG